MSIATSLRKIELQIQKARPEDQREFLARLPHLLNITFDDLWLLKAAEESFTFWNNPDDIVYDSL